MADRLGQLWGVPVVGAVVEISAVGERVERLDEGVKLPCQGISILEGAEEDSTRSMTPERVSTAWS